MLELSSPRKNKVHLNDYDCQQDVENRMLLADFSAFDLEVLEEILYSPLKFSIKKLSRSMGCKEEDLGPILKKLGQTGLLSLQGDETVLVDKDLRKYFEFQIVRFDPEFKPDTEFLLGLLRKVPIHILPVWYSIPRTSNNIFESILEKYLLTPQIFQRYFLDLNFGEGPIHGIMNDLFSAPDFKLYSSDVIAKYNLERRQFEELMLLLEFNFIGCVSYEREDDHWIEAITPYHEWQEYLRFNKATEAPQLNPKASISRFRSSDFAFVEDMGSILAHSKKRAIPLPSWQPGSPLPRKTLLDLASLCSLPHRTETDVELADHYLAWVIQKLLLIDLADLSGGKLVPLEGAASFFNMTLENRALHLYRHAKNRILNTPLPAQVATERNIREAEKSIKRVLHGGWVLFDEFIKGVLVTLSENSVITLRKTGKHWKYSLPTYSESEKSLLKATLFEWLFETGMVATGTVGGRDCFSVTPFGRYFFEE